MTVAFFAVAGSEPDPFRGPHLNRYRHTTARTPDTIHALPCSYLQPNWNAVCTLLDSSWTCIPEYSGSDNERGN
jgi:hypothetical protein